MKRWIWRALVFLLFGAVINVAVAWACVLGADGGSLWRSWRSLECDGWPCPVPSDWPRPRLRLITEIPGIAVERTSAHREPPRRFVTDGRHEHQRFTIETTMAGWPAPALVWDTLAEDGTPNAIGGPVRVPARADDGTWHGAWQGGIPPPEWLGLSQPWKRLPIRPRWAGLVFNTLFLTGCVWGLQRLALQCRASIRCARGLCPHCAYPTGTSPVCTECGKPVKARPGQTA